nr:hypothetical protein [Tanacetum cinerariifolium]
QQNESVWGRRRQGRVLCALGRLLSRTRRTGLARRLEPANGSALYPHEPGQCEVLSSTTHARQQQSERLAADSQEMLKPSACAKWRPEPGKRTWGLSPALLGRWQRQTLTEAVPSSAEREEIMCACVATTEPVQEFCRMLEISAARCSLFAPCPALRHPTPADGIARRRARRRALRVAHLATPPRLAGAQHSPATLPHHGG